MAATPRAAAVPLLAVLGSVTALGVGTSFAKQLFPVVGALGTTSLRVGFSALILLAMWRPWRWALSRADAVSIVRYGIALGLMNLLFYLSLRTIPFGVAVAIEFSGPLTVALWNSRKRIDFVWLALAVLGLGLLLPLQGHAAALDPVGVSYALAAAVFWAAYIVFGKRVDHLHAGQSVALGLAVAAVVVVLLWAFGTQVLRCGTRRFCSLVWQWLRCPARCRSRWKWWRSKRLPKEAFGIMISMEPAVAALLGLVLLHGGSRHCDVAGHWLHHVGCRRQLGDSAALAGGLSNTRPFPTCAKPCCSWRWPAC